MRRLYRLTVTLLREWIRDREAVFFVFVFPIILLLIFSVVFAGAPAEFEIAVQNNDLDEDGEPTELSATFIDALAEPDPIDLHHIDSDRDLANVDRLEADIGYQRVVVVPDGFEESVRTQSGRVRMAVIQDTIQLFEEDIPQDELADIEDGIAEFEEVQADTDDEAVPLQLLVAPDDDAAGAIISIVDSVVATFNDRTIGIQEPTVAVEPAEVGDEGLGAADYFLPAFIVAMIMFNGLLTVPSAVAKFRRDGTLKRLAASPLRRREWILANLIQQSVISLLVVAVMLLIARVAFGVTAVPGPLAVLLIIVGTIAFGGLGMVVGSFIRDPGAAISLGAGIAFPLMFVSGIFWELELMPETVQQVAELSPVTHYHRSLRELMILESMDGVWLTLAVLTVMAVLFVSLAVYLTTWDEFG